MKGIADKFNEYFTYIGRNLASKITSSTKTFDSFLSGNFCDSMSFLPSDANEVINVASCLKTKMTAGRDNVSLAIMKGSIQFIANPLACIINNSMRSRIFPDNLKVARVVPIFKSGDHKLFNNYRPISVL